MASCSCAQRLSQSVVRPGESGVVAAAHHWTLPSLRDPDPAAGQIFKCLYTAVVPETLTHSRNIKFRKKLDGHHLTHCDGERIWLMMQYTQ